MTKVPVALFAYSRPRHLARTLDCLRQNNVPLIYAFSDGPRANNVERVREVRELLRSIDWCDVRLIEREQNIGLGASIRSGVAEVLEAHESLIVVEDDLISVPGTYEYLSAALDHYHNDPRVMSVTGWTHARITPPNVSMAPYFDGRAECWIWGAWRRSWEGMQYTARELMEQCRADGLDVHKYGSDLVDMAQTETERNIWAVRFLFLHLRRRQLCLRPPWSMVEHIGDDDEATNRGHEAWLKNPALRPAPAIPEVWPDSVESRDCATLHRLAANGPASPRPHDHMKRLRGWLGRKLGRHG